MRVAFAGTPAFAARALEAIAAGGHAIPLVLTRPDRPVGRGLRLAPSEVAQSAERLGLDVLKPASLLSADLQAAIRRAIPDVMVVAAFGVIIPAAVLEIPARGALNIHASLLPRWRGAAPIQRAILAGDSRTGITIMRMDEGLDTGPALLQRAVDIGACDTAGSLTESLAALGARCIVDALATLDLLSPQPQDEHFATYASKIEKREARIDWSRSSVEVDRQVRAFNPSPGAETCLDGEVLKVWVAQPTPDRGMPGTVLEAGRAGICVACGEGALRLTVVQRAGGKRLPAGPFLQGYALQPGRILGFADLAASEKGSR